MGHPRLGGTIFRRASILEALPAPSRALTLTVTFLLFPFLVRLSAVGRGMRIRTPFAFPASIEKVALG